jgi:hypothetical protein
MFIHVGKEENQVNVKKIVIVDRLAQVKKKAHLFPRLSNGQWVGHTRRGIW